MARRHDRDEPPDVLSAEEIKQLRHRTAHLSPGGSFGVPGTAERQPCWQDAMGAGRIDYRPFHGFRDYWNRAERGGFAALVSRNFPSREEGRRTPAEVYASCFRAGWPGDSCYENRKGDA
jgi:hypothetical protein